MSTSMEYGRNTNDELNAVTEHLSRQLGLHSIPGGFDNLKAAELGASNPLNHLEQTLKDEIIGQPEAAESIVSALRRESIRNPKRPIANLMFLGPTGVGKSELGKELARQLHGENGGGFLRIDCSNYSSNHTVTALLGSPPSYVGREQKPVFGSPELAKDRCVVMFDEVEKGSQALWDLLLQIMDDGEITLNGDGSVASFKKAIIILTSNVGSADMAKTRFGLHDGGSSEVEQREMTQRVKKALGNQFRPEIIGRLDDTVVFNKLSDTQYGLILERYIELANERYQRHGIMLTLTPELRDELVASCDERHTLGARPILRRYEKIVESLLADHITTGGIPQGNRVYAVSSNVSGRSVDSRGVDLYYAADKDLQRDGQYVAPAASLPEYATSNTSKELSTAHLITAQLIGVQAAGLAYNAGAYIRNRAQNLRSKY